MRNIFLREDILLSINKQIYFLQEICQVKEQMPREITKLEATDETSGTFKGHFNSDFSVLLFILSQCLKHAKNKLYYETI